jgi:hypothetical protein
MHGSMQFVHCHPACWQSHATTHQWWSGLMVPSEHEGVLEDVRG